MKPITDNELIAEFMLWDRFENSFKGIAMADGFFKRLNDDGTIDIIGELKFHSSWDWLMPVCKKWSELQGIINHHEYLHYSQLLQDTVSRYEITPAFHQLVENIKWYNTEKNENI